MKANFKNPTTGELFLVTTSRTTMTDKGPVETDALGNQLVDPKTGEILISIPFDDRTDDDYTTIVTKASPPQEMGKGNRDKAIKHFKERAHRHNRTEGAKQERISSIKKQVLNKGSKHE